MSFCSSLLRQVVAGISVFFICTSVISFCLKTLPGLRVEMPSALNHTSSNISDIYKSSTLPILTTEANLISSTATHRPAQHGSGLFNRYAVSIKFESIEMVATRILFVVSLSMFLFAMPSKNLCCAYAYVWFSLTQNQSIHRPMDKVTSQARTKI